MTHNEIKLRNAQIVIDAKAGMSNRELMHKYDLHHSSFSEIFAKAGFGSNRSIRSIASFQILAALFDPNKTQEQIADDFKVTKQRVSQIYIAAVKAKIPGLPIRSRSISCRLNKNKSQ